MILIKEMQIDDPFTQQQALPVAIYPTIMYIVHMLFFLLLCIHPLSVSFRVTFLVLGPSYNTLIIKATLNHLGK